MQQVQKLYLCGLLSLSSFSSLALDCAPLASWDAGGTYVTNNQVKHQNKAYKANWWNQNRDPALYSNPYQEWTLVGSCDGAAENQLPVASITSPAANTSFATGTVISFSANATDPDGSISKVDFYLNNQLLSSDSSSPYQAPWTAVAGNHQLYAVAFDNENASTQSSTIAFSVTSTPGNQAPQVSLSSPANNSQYRTGETILISASASDSDGTVAKVQFYLGTSLLAEQTAAPYTTSWTAVAGQQQLRVVATDNLGASSEVSVLVNVMDEQSGHAACRPDGLYATPDLDIPYCTVYDSNGRELMGADHKRRIIGYFTSWRNGANGQPTYLVPNIPWSKISHINYAFAHVNASNQVGIGNTQSAANAATGMEWPGVTGAEMDPEFNYKGHFNLLNKYKKQYPHVKTLISIGGWAETGGFFNDAGERVASGGFYSMTTNADNSINYNGINTFADSVVSFLRTYGFDGADIDYEYPSTMKDSGNPDDFTIANARRGGLMASYVVLMKTLREKLDAASVADGKHYLLTIASPSSGYLLRGMEAFPVTQYLDYVNIMTYDLHGAWNQYVGPNAALFDDGQDNELATWNYYNSAQYQNLGYLNTDWAYHYFRGAMQAGRINIGVPYYSRGWNNVTGGTHGLWGKAPLPNQNQCPAGTGGSAQNQCGSGAVGIDNLWHDLGKDGNEMPAGSNPLWHTKNLQAGILGSYAGIYGLDPVNQPEDQLIGTYQHHYDSTLVAPWLWNPTKKVFLSIEDETSIAAKADYIIERGIGGVMFWELAGDYSYNSSTGEYGFGDDLTSIFYNKFKTASLYGNQRDPRPLPASSLDLKVSLGGFKLGDSNYPLNPKLTLVNNSGQTLPGGTKISFDVPTATGNNVTDQSGLGTTVIENGSNSSGNNIGGLDNDFHRVEFTLPGHSPLAAGATLEMTLNYYLPIPMPSNWRITVGTESFALKQDYPQLPAGTISGGSGGDGGNNGGSCAGVPATVVTYPAWPQGNHAAGGNYIRYQNLIYKANWWTNSVPGSDSSWTLICTAS
ncbi:chitinase [Rheinheimera sp. A13L]|uniref:chitinase C-terminal domain-containing protein n=1 Tax=Rheinheimera sp. A13L TaxID=506534 RepID=UPI00021254FF|nr:glycosyl hydrolase family 18 protein [Rheinheimera sp. A13L]EGM77264.1 chitinase [Rheinheimera sp. A13L]